MINETQYKSVQLFYKISVPKNFAKLTRKHLCWISFLVNLQAFSLHFIQQETPAQVFFCKFCETFNNIFLTKHRPMPKTPKIGPTPLTPFFLTHAKILWTHATQATFLTHAKILWTTPPKPPTPNFDPRHLRYSRHPDTHVTHATHTI